MFCYVDKLSCFVIIGYDMLIQRMHKKWHIIWNFGKNCILSRAFFFYRNQDNTPSYINIAQKSMFYCVLSLVCMHIFHFTLCTVTQWIFVTFNVGTSLYKMFWEKAYSSESKVICFHRTKEGPTALKATLRLLKMLKLQNKNFVRSGLENQAIFWLNARGFAILL